MNTNIIKSKSANQCHVCGSQGITLYNDLVDRMFCAPGKWSMKKCINSDCGLCWLDPAPLKSELWKAYKTYYTHSNERSPRRSNFIKDLIIAAKSVNLYTHFGYTSRGIRFSTLAIALSPLFKRQLEIEIRGLNATKCGKLLDIGCGNGEWLLKMRDLGWDVEGVDIDKKAVKLTNEKGIMAYSGDLENNRLPSNSYDAITLNHVIEHLPNPSHTLSECIRLLKPGGSITISTPNNESITHRLYKSNWRALEPPRHINIFSIDSLTNLIKQSGFEISKSYPHSTSYIPHMSSLIAKGAVSQKDQNKKRPMRYRIITVIQEALTKFSPNIADCIAILAKKPST